MNHEDTSTSSEIPCFSQKNGDAIEVVSNTLTELSKFLTTGQRNLVEAHDNLVVHINNRLNNLDSCVQKIMDFLAIHPKYFDLINNNESSCMLDKMLELLQPHDPVGFNFIRCGKDNDGGYVMVDNICEGDTCYSFGINDDVSWDHFFANLGCEIYMYDHTIKTLPYENDKFHWHPIGIGSREGLSGPLKTMEEILIQNGHIENEDIILKMDVEGVEYDAFLAMNEKIIKNFKQIVIEVHAFSSFENVDYAEKRLNFFKKLDKHHCVTHVHANNCGTYDVIGVVSPFQIPWN